MDSIIDQQSEEAISKASSALESTSGIGSKRNHHQIGRNFGQQENQVNSLNEQDSRTLARKMVSSGLKSFDGHLTSIRSSSLPNRQSISLKKTKMLPKSITRSSLGKFSAFALTSRISKRQALPNTQEDLPFFLNSFSELGFHNIEGKSLEKRGLARVTFRQENRTKRSSSLQESSSLSKETDFILRKSQIRSNSVLWNSTYRNTVRLGPFSRADLKSVVRCEASNSNLTTPLSASFVIDMNCE